MKNTLSLLFTVRGLCPPSLFSYVLILKMPLWQCHFHHLFTEAHDKVLSADTVWKRVSFPCHCVLLTSVPEQPPESPDDLLSPRLHVLFVSRSSVQPLLSVLMSVGASPAACVPLWVTGVERCVVLLWRENFSFCIKERSPKYKHNIYIYMYTSHSFHFTCFVFADSTRQKKVISR